MSMAMYRPSVTYVMNTIVSAYYSVQILIRAWFEQTAFEVRLELALHVARQGASGAPPPQTLPVMAME
jgi:hypothetical protein